ncbi:MAG: hypothetical protein II781_01650, partial [Clostridia bacterium]|nr:hypothetical protein [Clostridia bacterium]
MKYMRRILTGILCLSLLLCLLPAASLAKPVSGSFIAMGGDLTEKEAEKVMDLLDVDDNNIE